MGNTKRNKSSNTKRNKLSTRNKMSSNRNKKYKLKSIKKSNKRHTVKYGGMESGEEVVNMNINGITVMFYPERNVLVSKGKAVPYNQESEDVVLCGRCDGTGKVKTYFVENGDGPELVCNLCNGAGINITEKSQKPKQKNPAAGLSRMASLTPYIQTQPDCWAHVLSKIIGAWEKVILDKRVTPHLDVLNKLKEKGRGLGSVGHGYNCGIFGGLENLLKLLNHNNESDKKKQWDGMVINDMTEVQELLHYGFPLYMEIYQSVRKQNGQPLFKENHAVVAEHIEGVDIQIFNSHGNGAENHRLQQPVSNYMTYDQIRFFLIWPKCIWEHIKTLLLELEQIDVLRRITGKK